ncbi:hypothetical protein Hypma_012965 [Hypsizygus marmoreus]|uniref:Uncharacterized protein n=1 Tax=Hypsizygus marmoreus TaxID=39966 RepID=A0A369JMB2_HYPMA|nr:hypothetical protein Hypma_012965 [Hypsizygus marmoreus]
MDGDPNKSRPTTPESPLTNSFYHANSTVDDLTAALANFSRVPSPEPPTILTCCCGNEDCENAKAWMELKSRLESRLILSAKVGQALLQRHEAYVRRHEGHKRSRFPPDSVDNHLRHETSFEQPELGIPELVKENAILEKRLNQALVNNEVTEVSNKTILNELQEARSTISRLTAHHARSVGWETRLSTAINERDDMQQERDGESNRAKLAESRLVAMKDKTAKLQSEVRRLQDILEERRSHRLESSENLLQDARVRLETLQSSLGRTAMVEHTELTTVLESLVNDNETLKRDNAELQTMLTESREEIHTLQEEVEDHRVKPPSRTGAGTPRLKQHIFTGSVPASLGKDNPMPFLNPRSASLERKYRRPFEPLTPDTSRRPLSPADSLTPSEPRWPSFSQPHPRYPASHISIEVDESSIEHDDPSSPEKPKNHKILLLLTRSRAVQTDGWPGVATPSPLPSYISSASPQDPRSESSSFSESLSSNLSILLERLVVLHNRMTQADALTLTNRLKRQNLKGADVGHLSRITINQIISEASNLRAQFRFLLEDDNVITSCTRKDFRVIFKLFKDIFSDMGEMRVTLNDLILDPSIASRVSELALNPSKAELEKHEKEREAANSSSTGGWMAPISKLFSPGRVEPAGERPGLTQSSSSRGIKRPPPRFIPKLGPALSASTTTVKVEFSGTGVGRSTTSTVASQLPATAEESLATSPPSQNPTSAIMDIFAGAPRSATPDPWVVVPRGPRKVQSFMKPASQFNHATIRRSSNISRGHGGLSRDVDAVIDVERPIQDDEEPDDLAPLLQRTLRRRGLSDSSIHSTFTTQAEEPRHPPLNIPSSEGILPRETWPDRHSVLQTLSRTVQSFRTTASGTFPGPIETSVAISPQRPSAPFNASLSRSAEPRPAPSPAGLRNLLPNLSSWAAAGNIVDPRMGSDAFLVGNVRDDESFIPRTRRPGESHGHEFF